MKRETLTVKRLLEEAAEDVSRLEEAARAGRVMARGRAMARVLESLPGGFRVERVRGVNRGGDPGAEYTLIDANFRPERVVARVDRRCMGAQRLSWSKAPNMATVEQADAMACVLRLAVADAESRR